MKHLNPDALYEIRLWGVSSSRKTFASSTSLRISTLPNKAAPQRVLDFQLKDLVLIEKDYDAVVKWTPGEGRYQTQAKS